MANGHSQVYRYMTLRPEYINVVVIALANAAHNHHCSSSNREHQVANA